MLKESKFVCPKCNIVPKETTMPILNEYDLYFKTDDFKERFERRNLFKRFFGKGICWNCYNKYSNYNKGVN